MDKRLRVCMVLEGSYPFITGGVSAWVQDIIEGLPDIDFCLFTISPGGEQVLRYKLPPNVVEHRDIVLSSSHASTAKPAEKQAMMNLVNDIHGKMFAGEAPELNDLIRLIPEGYNMNKDAI